MQWKNRQKKTCLLFIKNALKNMPFLLIWCRAQEREKENTHTHTHTHTKTVTLIKRLQDNYQRKVLEAREKNTKGLREIYIERVEKSERKKKYHTHKHRHTHRKTWSHSWYFQSYVFRRDFPYATRLTVSVINFPFLATLLSPHSRLTIITN